MQDEIVITWPAPAGESASPDFAVTVADRELFVYHTPVRAAIQQNAGLWTHDRDYAAERASYALWDQRGPVEVVVRPSRPFQRATLLPARAGVETTIVDGEIRFTMDRPRKLTLLLDGATDCALHLFAGEPETDVPAPDDPDVLYFGPGVHDIDGITLKDGQTIYVAGGAILRPRLKPGDQGKYNKKWKVTFFHGIVFKLHDVENVTIRGRGIVDCSAIPHPGWNVFHFKDAKRVRVSGLTLVNAANWNFVIGLSEDVDVRDVRIISGRLNSDGINSVNSRRVTISDCFVRNHDDSIVVKTVHPDRPAEDITVTNNVVWNDWGYALGVSYETRSPIRRILFRGNDIVYARNWCLGVHLSDGAVVEDIRFEDTAIDDLTDATTDGGPGRPSLSKQPMILKADIVKDVWGKDDKRGQIRDVVIDGLVVYGDRWWPSVVHGYDAEHLIDGVLWRNCRLAGKPAFADLAPLHISANEHVRDMRAESQNDGVE